MGVSSFTFAGNWQVKFGGSVIAPSEDTTTPLGVVKADHEYAFTPSVEYFLVNLHFRQNYYWQHLLITMYCSMAKKARIKQLPPTITAKYHFKTRLVLHRILVSGQQHLFLWMSKVLL